MPSLLDRPVIMFFGEDRDRGGGGGEKSRYMQIPSLPKRPGLFSTVKSCLRVCSAFSVTDNNKRLDLIS